MITTDLGAGGVITAEKFAVTCEYDHGGAVTHTMDHEGREIGGDFAAAERFAFVQESDPRCINAYVITVNN